VTDLPSYGRGKITDRSKMVALKAQETPTSVDLVNLVPTVSERNAS